jgi:hypothetical protein
MAGIGHRATVMRNPRISAMRTGGGGSIQELDPAQGNKAGCGVKPCPNAKHRVDTGTLPN